MYYKQKAKDFWEKDIIQVCPQSPFYNRKSEDIDVIFYLTLQIEDLCDQKYLQIFRRVKTVIALALENTYEILTKCYSYIRYC